MLGVLRNSAAPQRFDLERRAYPVVQPAVKRLRPDVALLRVGPFVDRTLQQVCSALLAEWRRQPFRGLVLDLRGNPGGLLDVAVGLSAAFLPRDAVVGSTVGRAEGATAQWQAQPEHYTRRLSADPLKDLPAAVRTVAMVVLVDEGTAAGAEFVAAALRDHRRAPLVGRRTFGRGSIQTLRLLDADAALKLTTAHWLTPSGERIADTGLQPQRVVEPASADGDLAAALEELRL